MTELQNKNNVRNYQNKLGLNNGSKDRNSTPAFILDRTGYFPLTIQNPYLMTTLYTWYAW